MAQWNLFKVHLYSQIKAVKDMKYPSVQKHLHIIVGTLISENAMHYGY